MNIVELIFRAGIVVKLVLLCLLVLSVVSWAVIVLKHYYLRRAARESATFMEAFESGTSFPKLAELARTLPASPLANVFLHMMRLHASMPSDRLRSSLARVTVHETERLRAYLIILATTGSSAPFIGLFGTVWGIVHAFQRIGATGSASLAVVAPGIAEALVATAAGLAAAIPAVAAYNAQTNLADQLAAETEPVAAEWVGLLTAKG